MTIDFKMTRYLGMIFVPLSVVNFFIRWILDNPMRTTLLIELAYFTPLLMVWVTSGIWLKERVNEAWDKALAKTLKPYLELRRGDHVAGISEDAIDGSGTTHTAVVDKAQDPHPPTEAPPREA